MVNYKLAKVRAEIERRRDRNSKAKRIESALEDNAILSFIDSVQKEPKECMYSKDNYTDEDRKVLCEGCEEKCKFNKKEELVSEDLEQEINAEWNCYSKDGQVGCINRFSFELIARHFANWQKEHLMAKAVDATVHIDAGGYPYIPQMELYDYDKDVSLAKEGDKYKVILIKED